MRSSFRKVVFLIAWASLAGTASASPVASLEDPVGDLSGPRQSEPDYIDLTAIILDLENEPRLELSFAGDEDLATNQAPVGSLYARYLVQVEYRSQIFTLDVRLEGQEGEARYWVAREGGARTYNGTSQIQDAKLSLPLPGSALSTAQGFMPSPGESVRIARWASSWDALPAASPDWPGSPLHAVDHGDVVENLAVVPGQTSDLLMSSPRLVQRANGGETTYAWDIEFGDLSGEDRVLAINMTGPGDARFYHPNSVSLAGGETGVHRVYAILPFGHAHGRTYDIVVSATDGDVTEELDLQVLFVHPPQPAGHHDTVYLHAQSEPGPNQYGTTWMNTTEETPPEATIGTFVSCEPGQGTRWVFPLEPALEIGIDADMERTARLEMTMEQVAPGPDFTLQARLGIEDDETEPDLGDEFTAEAAWPGMGTHTVEFDVPIPPELDYVEPAPGRNFVFVVQACEEATAAAPPLLVHNDLFEFQSGGSIVLPFFEFRPANSPLPTDLNIRVDPGIAMAPPGGVASWTVRANGPGVESLAFDVVAPEAFAAQIERTGPGAFDVSIIVPETGKDGNLLDVILVGSDPDETTVVLRAIVDENAAFVDRETGKGRESPGLAPVFLLGGLFLLACIRRGAR